MREDITRTTCDSCGGEIPVKTINFSKSGAQDIMHVDLCSDCMDLFLENVAPFISKPQKSAFRKLIDFIKSK